MTYDSILKNVANHIRLDDDEISHFTSLLTNKEVTKKSCVLKEGQLYAVVGVPVFKLYLL